MASLGFTIDDLSSIGDSYFDSKASGYSDSATGCSDFASYGAKPKTLFGRSEHEEQLLGAYQRLLETHEPEIVTIHGESGTGKTSLVEHFRDRVIEGKGYFTMGKYMQNSGLQEPYSAIMAAFSDLCDIVSQSRDLTEERRCKIKERLIGFDGVLLSKSISSLSSFINASYQDEDEMVCRDETAYTRFKVACMNFLHVMASEENPIVLFIDDIQWMDKGSKELLRLLLQDSGLKNVMLILAYREEDSEKVEGLFFEETHKRNIMNIQLQTLLYEEVKEMVCDWMGATTDAVVELGHLVALKTNANPLHVIQFMECIEDIGLLKYDCRSSSWIFDTDEIHRQLMISETLADLLLIKIQRLSLAVQQMLKVAAMIGFEFSRGIVVDTLQKFQSYENATAAARDECEAVVASCINVALKEGFLTKTKGGDYMFSHDKLQASFQSMLSAEDKELYHLKIGETFLDYEGSELDCDGAYHAAVHLNLAPAFKMDMKSQVRLARLNLKAAKEAMEKSAFVVAADLLRHGLSLIPEESKWRKYFNLTFEFSELLARIEFIIGNYDQCKVITRENLARGKTTEMLINSYVTNVEVRMAANELRGATVAASQALRALGIKMPSGKPGLLRVLVKTIKVKRMIGKKSDEEILNLPRMTDPIIAAATKLLQHISIFLMFQDEDVEAMYYSLLGAELTLRYGLSPYSTSAFACYGMAELSLGNYDRAYRFGTLALRLLDTIKCKDAECPTVGVVLTILTHWKDPLTEAPERLMKAVEIGVSIGDIIYGTIFIAQVCSMYLNLSVHLETLEQFTRDSYQRMRNFSSDDGVIMWAQPGLQHVLNLRMRNAEVTEIVVLTGEVMNETEYKKIAQGDKNSVLLAQLGANKAEIACLFGEYDLSLSTFTEIESSKDPYHLSYGNVTHWFYSSLACFGIYRESGKSRALRMAQRRHKKLMQVASHGSSYPAPFVSFLDAEELSVRKRINSEAVVIAYEKAIAMMNSTANVKLEALGHEQLGFYLASTGELSLAKEHLEISMQLWDIGYGASAKSEWVERKHAEIFFNAEGADNFGIPRALVGDVVICARGSGKLEVE